jgi:hypothetical protein
MRGFYFYTDKDTPNYLEEPDHYKFRLSPNMFCGKYIHSNYLYWILKNNNINNIKLLQKGGYVNKEDVVFFHYDFKEDVKELDCKRVQIVSDRPRVDFADYYCVNYKQNDNEFLLDEPIPVGLTKKTPSFPPVHFHSNLASHHIDKSFKNIVGRYSGINITFETNAHVTDYNFDVFFFLRNYNYLDTAQKLLSDIKPKNLKHASRLLQSWIMEVPAILTPEKAMTYYVKSEYDFLAANNVDEFIFNAHKLREDKELFCAMIENGRKRKQHISNQIIVDQFTFIKNYLNKA